LQAFINMNKAALQFFDGLFLLRIPLLAPVWTILLLGWIACNPEARPGGNLAGGVISALSHEPARLWAAMAAFSLIVASIYVMNQIADVESDRINRKLFILPDGHISMRSAWIIAVCCSILGLAGSLFFDGIMFLLFIGSLALGVLYDFPPANLKNRAIGGTFANFLGHGVLTFLVGWYALRSGFGVPSGFLQRSAGDASHLVHGLLPSLSAGFANAAVYITTTIPDAAGDRATGKRTFCVAFGEKTTSLWSAILCGMALLFAFYFPHNAWVMVLQAAVSLLFFIYLTIAFRKDLAVRAFKWPVFLLTALIAFYVPAYGVLIIAVFFGSKMYYRLRFCVEYPTFKAQ